MSPEQCRGSSECDHRTDLYALGCILFELLTGQPPYGNRLASAELFAAHLHSPVPDLSRFVTVPSEIVRLVTRLLAKRPDDRPRTALEVIADIDGWFASRSASAPRRPTSLRIALVASCGIVFSLAALGVWYREWRSDTGAEKHEDSATNVDAAPIVVFPALAAPASDAPLGSPIALPTPLPPPRSPTLPSSPPSLSSPKLPTSPPLPSRDTPSLPESHSVARPIPKAHGAHSSPPGDVTSELGEANPSDVNTTVSDFEHH
jgi:serine/threonine protein kinase